MRAEPTRLDRLARAAATLRRRALLTWGAAALAAGAGVVLGLSLAPPGVREGRGSPWPLLAALLLAGALLAAFLLGRRAGRRLTPRALAREADRGAGLGEGDVLAALELCRAAGTDAGLEGLHGRRVGERLAGLDADRLLPVSGPTWRRRCVRAALAGVVTIALLALAAVVRPGPTRAAAAALGAPWRTAFPAPLPPLVVRAASDRVARGAEVRIEVEAPLRDSVRLAWRTAGEPADRRLLRVGPDGRAAGTAGPLEGETLVWAEDRNGRSSDTLRVGPLEPLLVQDLRVRVSYPRYLGRDPEEHRGRLPPLVLPEGTRIRVEGETNHAADTAWLAFSPPPGAPAGVPGAVGGGVPLALDGVRFSGGFTPRTSGEWRWRLESTGGVGEPVLPEALRVILIPDGEPRIRLLFPPPDTLLGSELAMPLVVDVDDDLGLRDVALVRWRSSRGEAMAREALEPDPDGRRRVVFRHLLDLRGETLVPGDTVFYRIEARDGHPSRGPTRSETFLLRVATLGERRAQRAQGTAELAERGDELARAADDLSRAAAEAERRGPSRLEEPGAAASERGAPGVEFEGTEEARGVLDEAERTRDALDAMARRLEEMREELAAAELPDPELGAQLRELAERYRELAERGLTQRIEALSDALRQLDAEGVREALERLSGDAARLREEIERTLGLLERAALEQAVKSARADAEELADAQRAAAAAEEAEPREWAQRERDLAERADALAGRLEEVERRLAEAGAEASGDSTAAAGERARRAAGEMREAAEAATRPDASEAEPGAGGSEAAGPSEAGREAARRAAESMESASEALGSAAGDLGQGSRGDAAEALARARAEALELAAAEARLADAARGEDEVTPEAWRARQAAVRQGLDNLLSRLWESAGPSGLVDPATGEAAGEAAARMDRLLTRLSSDGARRLPSRAEADGIADALNELGAMLLANEGAVRAAGPGSEGENAAERLASLAQRQQGVTQETSSLLAPGPRPPGGEERARELARRQEEIARRLDELEDPDGELLGRPEELAREAEEISRRLGRDGASRETLERQRALFRRMLDAGRSLEDEDLDPSRRESRTGRAAPRPPPRIDPALLRGSRFPLPEEATLRGLPLFYRPLIFEYFDRLNRDPGMVRPAGEPAGRAPSGEEGGERADPNGGTP